MIRTLRDYERNGLEVGRGGVRGRSRLLSANLSITTGDRDISVVAAPNVSFTVFVYEGYVEGLSILQRYRYYSVFDDY
jgi:hypothetical protein